MVLLWILQCLLVLLSVAFFTLFERNVIGLFHTRLGPNNVSYLGVLQPLLDAFKLLTNQIIVPYRSNKLVYHMGPNISLFLSLFIWITFPLAYSLLSMGYSILFFFCVSSVIVFFVLLAGWASNSKYSLIGSLRSVAQSISYEAVFSTLIVLIMVLTFSYSINSMANIASLVFMLIFPIWFTCSLAETHRAPFDFSEAESELVSGFNTEYSGAYFAFVFLSEYAILLYSCFIIVVIFFGALTYPNYLVIVVLSLVLSFIYIWVRITFCRFRYDSLIILAWKTLLPYSLILFILYLFFI